MTSSFPRRALLAASLGLGLFAAPLVNAAGNAAPSVKVLTSMGEFVIELDPARAPKTVENFLQYVKAGQYSGTVFHRVIPGFMIQGGGMKADMSEKPTRAPIPLESMNGLKNERGTVAMARRGEPNSATAQFFVNVVDNAFLDATSEGRGYAVFGRVVSGMEVVDKIREVPTANRGPYQNVPVQPVVITSVTLQP